MLVSRRKYEHMVTEIKTLQAANKKISKERDIYKSAYDDLRSFIYNIAKDHNLDFPATTKVEKPENKIY